MQVPSASLASPHARSPRRYCNHPRSARNGAGGTPTPGQVRRARDSTALGAKVLLPEFLPPPYSPARSPSRLTPVTLTSASSILLSLTHPGPAAITFPWLIRS